MIKMLVCSLYNTLINEEDAISMETMLEIDRIRKNKTLFTVLTNRNYEEVLYYNKDYPFIDYIISLNGNLIYDVRKNSILKKNKLSKNKIRVIEEIFKNNKKIYYTKDKIYYDFPEEDIYKIEVELKRKDKEKLNLLEIDYSILELHKNKYLEITETNTLDSINYLLNLNKIKKDETCIIIGNDSENYLLSEIKNITITKRCSPILKNKIKLSNKKIKLRKIEDILKDT